MTASVGVLEILVTTATVLSSLGPVILVVLWCVDAKKGRLW